MILLHLFRRYRAYICLNYLPDLLLKGHAGKDDVDAGFQHGIFLNGRLDFRPDVWMDHGGDPICFDSLCVFSRVGHCGYFR